MLIEKKIHIGETTRTKTNILVSGATYSNGVVTVTAPNHNILSETEIYFERPCGDGEIFQKKFSVYEVVDKDTFRIQYDLDNYPLSPSSMRKENVIIEVSGTPQDFLVVTFDENNKHICCKDRSGVNVRYFYNSDYTFGEPVEICKKQYDILFNNVTCYHTKSIDSEGDRVFDEPMLNITDHYVWYVDDVSGKTGMGGAFVPFSPNGYDNRSLMYLPWRDEYEKFVSKPLFCYDCRFFNLDGISALTEEISGVTEDLSLEFAQGTEVYMYPVSLNIELGLSDAFRLDLVHEDDVEEFIIERQQANISNIVDYEKRMFEPLYKSIRFNVFLRDREYNSETGEWNTSDGKYWFSLDANNGIVAFKKKLLNKYKGDLLGSLGFEDEDVFNQAERLNKTFLRLSFYDSTDRATQTLLYYSTMFINTSKQYAKYMRNVASNITPNEEYVDTPNENDDLALCCNFTAYDKFNMSGSSEGFYIYLFPDIVKGAEPTEIYMKVELNHAKYGNTIPLVYPTGNNGLPRLNYVKKYTTEEFGSGKLIDLPSLYNDMYIKIRVQRDYENNRYIWYIADEEGKSDLMFNLFEPRINETNERFVR